LVKTCHTDEIDSINPLDPTKPFKKPFLLLELLKLFQLRFFCKVNFTTKKQKMAC